MYVPIVVRGYLEQFSVANHQWLLFCVTCMNMYRPVFTLFDAAVELLYLIQCWLIIPVSQSTAHVIDTCVCTHTCMITHAQSAKQYRSSCVHIYIPFSVSHYLTCNIIRVFYLRQYYVYSEVMRSSWVPGARTDPLRFLARWCKPVFSIIWFSLRVCSFLGLFRFFELLTYLVVVWFSFASSCQVIGCEDRLRYDLWCVTWNVKPLSKRF